MTACNRLKGKVAIVTGGASGIGAATVRRVVEEGARATIADLDDARAKVLAKELGDAALAVPFDAGDVDSVARMVATTVEHFGRLDLLHNNAAIMSADIIAQDNNPVDIDFAVWDKTMEVNLRGYLAGCKFAIPHMLAGGGGSIVQTASGSGKMGDLGSLAYGTSKAGVIGFSRYVATIYGKQNIRSNVINPGLIRTEGGKKNVFGPMVEIMEHNTLVPRLGRPEDIAAAVAFLFSDDAAFVTGVELDVDGGMLCHSPYMTDVLRVFGTGQSFGAASA